MGTCASKQSSWPKGNQWLPTPLPAVGAKARDCRALTDCGSGGSPQPAIPGTSHNTSGTQAQRVQLWFGPPR